MQAENTNGTHQKAVAVDFSAKRQRFVDSLRSLSCKTTEFIFELASVAQSRLYLKRANGLFYDIIQTFHSA